MTAREDLKFACLQFEDHRAGQAGFFARNRPKLFRQVPNHGLGFRQKNVFLKSVLDRDRFRGPVRDDCTVVDTAGEFV